MVNRNPVARLQYYKKAGKFRWRLLAHNGRQLAECSKGHATKYAAQKNWQAVAAACAGDASSATGRHVVEDLTVASAAKKATAKKATAKKATAKKATAKKATAKKATAKKAGTKKPSKKFLQTRRLISARLAKQRPAA